MTQDWWNYAACADVDPNTALSIFFADENKSAENMQKIYAAKTICKSCPVQEDCLKDVMAHETSEGRYGIWGGYTAKERRALHRDQKRRHVA